MVNAYVLVEHDGSRLAPVTGELITAARVFGEVTAVLVGEPGAGDRFAGEIARLGAHTVAAAAADGASRRLILPAVDAVSVLAAASPAPILVAATATGNEVGGRLAARLGSGFLRDCVGVNADRTANQSIFGDTVRISAAVGGQCPVYSLRPGAVAAESHAGAGNRVSVPLPPVTSKEVTVEGFRPVERGARPDLAQASVVVAGGRGVGSRENFRNVVERLADSLGGAVGATRDAVDLDYCDGQLQIGQTGVTVSPDLYIGLGVSGAIQHLSGMQTARTVVAINTDEDAPIFGIADLAVVGDLFEVVPELIERIEARR